MASTDPNDKRPAGFHIKEWLSKVTTGWFGGGGHVVPAGGTSAIPDKAKQHVPPILARSAQRGAAQALSIYGSRMDEAKRKRQMWEQDLVPLVMEHLRKNFHEENYARMKLMPSAWNNVMRRVVADISILYSEPASRRIVDKKKDGKTQTQGSAPGTEEDAPTLPATKKPKPPPAKDEGKPTASKEADDGSTGEEDAPTDDTSKPKPAFGKKAVGAPADDVDAPDQAVPAGPIATGDPDVDALADVLELQGLDDEENESAYEKVMELADLDTVLDQVEHMVRTQDAIWVRPYVSYSEDIEVTRTLEDGSKETKIHPDPKSAKLHYIVYDPSCADVVPNPQNPTEALAWYYWADEMDEKGDACKRIYFFTPETVWKLNQDWQGIEAWDNPLGRLPVTVFRKELPLPGCYYVNGAGRDLYEGTLELCTLRSMQNGRYRDQGYKQLAMTGVRPEDVPADQVMGGPTPVFAPEGATVSVLDMHPDLMQMTQTVHERALELAASYGISAQDFESSGTPQSGFAKKLDRAKVLAENKRIRKFFTPSEKDLYKLTALTLNEYPIEGIDELDPEAEFEVDYGEPTFDEDPRDQAKIDALEVKLNTTNIVEVLKRRNPDLTEVELVRKAYRNKRINEVFGGVQDSALVDLLAQGATVTAGKSLGGGGGAGGPPGGAPPAMLPPKGGG